MFEFAGHCRSALADLNNANLPFVRDLKKKLALNSGGASSSIASSALVGSPTNHARNLIPLVQSSSPSGTEARTVQKQRIAEHVSTIKEQAGVLTR